MLLREALKETHQNDYVHSARVVENLLIFYGSSIEESSDQYLGIQWWRSRLVILSITW